MSSASPASVRREALAFLEWADELWDGWKMAGRLRSCWEETFLRLEKKTTFEIETYEDRPLKIGNQEPGRTFSPASIEQSLRSVKRGVQLPYGESGANLAKLMVTWNAVSIFQALDLFDRLTGRLASTLSFASRRILVERRTDPVQTSLFHTQDKTPAELIVTQVSPAVKGYKNDYFKV